MPEIKLLDQATINQIAAGEVIERPSSVVKELFENAVDAKATAITVEIREGGISLIRVTDNGCGIAKEQIPLAFKRHATSKITDIMDLVTVSSLGFRGEALSSIASVAQVEMITKPPETMLGVSYRIEDGEEREIQEIGAPDGTTILVRNLFGHVPARRKFLKSAVTEGNYIAQLMENMALSRPDLSVRFISNGQNRLYTTGNGRLKDLIYTIYGKEISSNLLEVSAQTDCFSVEGYIGKPIISRGNRSFENYYINGRFVKSTLISRAIETGFKSFMMQHRYPFAVLHLKIDPELIDVNVHPAKMELRFRREDEIYNQLTQIIEECLKGKPFIPDVKLEKEEERPKTEKKERGPEPFEILRRQAREEILPGFPGQGKKAEEAASSEVTGNTHGTAEIVQKPSKALREPSGAVREPVGIVQKPSRALREPEGYQTGIHRRIGQENLQKEEAVGYSVPPLLSEAARPHHRLIGQVFDTYWLIQYEDKLYIMDQHAAHEKVLYEKLVDGYKRKKCLSQMLSPAIMVTLNPMEELTLGQYRGVLEEIGYEIEAYGGKEYALTAVPADLYGIDEKELFVDLLAGLENSGEGQACELIAHRLASMACKAAVKGNQKITFAEADTLIGQLLKLDNPYACPHGRPTLISMSRSELEKKFKRIV